MHNAEEWRPTKVARRGKALKIPAARGGLAAGSILTGTYVSRWYASVIPKYARGQLLDAACGQVPYFQLYRPHIENVLCTDWPNSLHGAKFIDFASDLNTGIPLGGSSVDSVILSDVLEHIYEPHVLLGELFRVLKQGGTVMMITPFIYCVHEAPFDFFRYTPFALSRMASDAGFEVERMDCIGGKYLAIAEFMGKAVQGLSLPGRVLAAAIQRFALMLASPIPQSKKFPLTIGTVLRKPV